MPIYEYECSECGSVIEKIHKIDEEINILFCNKCNKLTNVKKIISCCSFKLNGGGWSDDGYVKSIDYVKEKM